MGTNLQGANLSQAMLNETDFSEANLNGADLTQAKIREVVFKGTNLMEATLNGADLTGTLLADAANLTPQQLSSAVLDGDASVQLAAVGPLGDDPPGFALDTHLGKQQ